VATAGCGVLPRDSVRAHPRSPRSTVRPFSPRRHLVEDVDQVAQVLGPGCHTSRSSLRPFTNAHRVRPAHEWTQECDPPAIPIGIPSIHHGPLWTV